jgi:hypothetical protein
MYETTITFTNRMTGIEGWLDLSAVKDALRYILARARPVRLNAMLQGHQCDHPPKTQGRTRIGARWSALGRKP